MFIFSPFLGKRRPLPAMSTHSIDCARRHRAYLRRSMFLASALSHGLVYRIGAITVESGSVALEEEVVDRGCVVVALFVRWRRQVVCMGQEKDDRSRLID